MGEVKRAKLNFAPQEVIRTELAGGVIVLKSPQELKPYPANMCEHLERWAQEAPDRVFVAERDAQGAWRKATYAQALETARRLAQGLVSRGMGQDKPVMILSDNSVDSAMLILASLYAGIPVAPISQAYSLVSQDHAKLKYIFGVVRPGLVYAASGKRFEKALSALDLAGVTVVVSGEKTDSVPALLLTELAEEPGGSVERARAAVTPETLAKILFTSGSTGTPKGVINTQRMMCSSQQAMAQVWPWLEEVPPVVLDWLPWSHTFGGNHNFNMVMRNGGSLYIDDGKPVPGLIEKTVRNLREISPTMYFNVPRGYDVLLSQLEKDDELNRAFFKDLRMLFYAAAALPQPLWERLEALSLKARGELVTMLSAWGSTETSPTNLMVHWEIDRAGVIGLPVPGTKIKLLPNGSKMEIRVKGPNIMPGYFRDEEQTKAVFDEDGYYMIGDAAKLLDPADASKGVVFDGRVSEDFKLTTGTWVHVGGLRVAAIEAAAPYVLDAVVTGHNRDYIGLMAWPNVEACRVLVGDPDADAASLAANPKVLATIADAVRKMTEGGKGSSMRIDRLRLLADPPNLDANEITDKQYINQRAVLERRAPMVESLYTDPVPAGVAVLGK